MTEVQQKISLYFYIMLFNYSLTGVIQLLYPNKFKKINDFNFYPEKKN